MKPWQIMAVGLVGLCVALGLLPLLQSVGALVAAVIAIAMIATVIAGFMFVPDRDSWTVWITQYSFAEGLDEEEFDLHSTQEPIAIRVEVARLWLLYVPTIVAVGFLMLLAARGIGGFDLSKYFSYPFLLVMRWGPALVWFLVGSWVYERWLLRRAEAAQAQWSRHGNEEAVAYYFIVKQEYYSGWDFPLFSYSKEPALGAVVMYRRGRAERNHLVAAFVFHRFTVIARGVQDLEAAREHAVQLASEPVE